MASVICFAHHHMTPAEYGFWQLCRDLSHKKGILYFDGRNMVKRFAGTRRNGVSKNYFYTLLTKLVKAGWLKQIEPRRRNPNSGVWMASVYRVLSHSEWVASNGSEQCKSEPEDDPSSPDNGTGGKSPVPITGVSSPDSGGVQSRWKGDPVPVSGHNPIVQSDVFNPMKQSDDNAMDLTCPDIQTGTSLTAEHKQRELPSFPPPVPASGQVIHTVPPALEYDPREHEWIAREGIGRELTADERSVRERLNRERVRP